MTAVGRIRVAVVIPTLNEAESIAAVVGRVPGELDAEVIVADNGSDDGTAAIAERAGATVVHVSTRGYGYACHAAVQRAAGSDVVVFIDGDGSMSPEDIPRLLEPIAENRADVVCGVRPVSRVLMPVHQRLGNRVIALLLRRHGVRLPELCPYRAVRTTTLTALELPGSRFAWPAQLLARAAAHDARITAIPVGYRERTAGRSKVGGSLRGSLAASWDIARVLLSEPPPARRRR